MRPVGIAYFWLVVVGGLLGLLGIAPQGVSAQSNTQPSTQANAQVVTLAELERKALGDRPVLQADAAAERAADADVTRARSSYYPEIGIGAHSSLAPGRELINVGSRERPVLVSGVLPLEERGAFVPQVRYGADLQLRTNLYDFGRTSAAVEASRAKRSAVNANREVTRAQITRAVRASYLGWLASSELVSVSERAATEAKERSTRVAALIAEGVRPQADLTPARSDELLAELELERARGDLDRRKLDVELAAGTTLPETAVPDRALLDEKPGARGADDPELHALELERTAALKAAEAQGTAHNPVLGAAASAGLGAQNARFFPNYNIGLSLSIPLWDGGGMDAAADAARARGEGIGARIADHQAHRAQEDRVLAIDLEHAAKRLATAEALLASCTAQLAEAEARYELGGGGIETIAVARAMMRRAHTEVLMAKIARVEATLR